MIERIISFIEESNVYSLLKDLERVIFQTNKYTKSDNFLVKTKADPHEILKTYSLEMIRGIGPKTKLKLEQFGIKNPYDLVHCQEIQGFSQKRIDNWRQIALNL
ncbi:MAG: hypothetical protein EAX96_14325 [Candidatus Lokiarchaeota archaeon]|nr:hypothetical protein [Candidatus Lokiarchaeota archaeon]